MLTAAHCLDRSSDPSTVHATFTYADGTQTETLTVDGAGIFVPSQWTRADAFNGWDWAILSLASPVTNLAIERYGISYAPADDWGIIDIVGYGWGGTGDVGENAGSARRAGQNQAEASWAGTGPGGRATLVFDFDGAEINSLQSTYGVASSTGLGAGQEVSLTHGDSGGPSFRNGKIVGVHSFIVPYGPTAGMYGDLSTDTRVSSYADLIDDVVPEPGTAGLLAGGLLLVLLRLRRARI